MIVITADKQARPCIGDLVVSARGHWDTPRLVIENHESAKALIGVLFDDEVRYVHYKHLEIISEGKVNFTPALCT